MQDSPTIFIGFGYKRANGKDSAVQHIIAERGNQFDIRRYAFGDLLKVEFFDALSDGQHEFWLQLARTRFEFPRLDLPHPGYDTFSYAEKVVWVDEHKEAFGKYLQLYGTGFRRAQDPFYWVNALDKKVADDKPKFALLSDMRFKNEYHYVGSKKGTRVKVVRHGYEPADGRSSKHISEVDLDGLGFEYVIEVQDGELAELKKDALFVFDHIVQSLQPEVPDFSDAAIAL